MLAADVDQPLAGPSLMGWLRRHVSPGTIVCLGAPHLPDVASDVYRIVPVTDLPAAAAAGQAFDHGWVNDAYFAEDPVGVATNLFTVIRPGGTLLLRVQFGFGGDPTRHRAFYCGSLRHIIQPLFEIVDEYFGDGNVAVLGVRRDAPSGLSMLQRDPDERAFYTYDRDLSGQIAALRSELSQLRAQNQQLADKAERIKASLDRRNKELSELRAKVAKLRRWLGFPLAAYRVLGRLKSAAGGRSQQPPADARTHVAGETPSSKAPDTTQGPETARSPAGPGTSTVAVGAVTPRPEARPAWRDVLKTGFSQWLDRAKRAAGEDVVVMFSGTTHVHEAYASRSVRLTNAYLRRGVPVFLNYYRSSNREPLPQNFSEHLFLSPIDATRSFLDDLLRADFGSKKKVLFVSFPHEMMVRYLLLAAQHGWVTVYDAHHDWEEVARAGMADWYSRGFEQYTARLADVVTAVSRPLARKIEGVAGRDVHVSANGVDAMFPRPSGPRTVGRRPVIGYYGELAGWWLDWPLVNQLAERYPDYWFEFAGHQAPAGLALPPNVDLIGPVRDAELAERSRTWAVAIAPLKNGPIADAADPIMVYECLYHGVPVVTTYLPQCRNYPGVTITEGRDEFIERVGHAVGVELSGEDVIPWLADNTWDRRVDQYSTLVDAVRRNGRSALMTVVGGTL